MTACLRGLPEDDRSRAWHEYGIEDVGDNPEDGKQGVILGNQEDSDGEDDFEDNDAFIITPRERPGVKQALVELFVDIPIKTIDYPPAMFTCEEWFRRQGTGRTLDFSEALRDSIVDTPRGKILLQYKPAPSCDQEAQNFVGHAEIIIGHFEVRRSYLKADLVDKAPQQLRCIHRPIDYKVSVINQQRPADTSLLMTSVSTARTVDRLPATQAPIKPEPFSMRIHYKEWTSGLGGVIGTQGVWEMFVAGVRAEVDLCGTEDVGHELQSYFRPSE
ncbi:hypothetical protein COL922a_013416 [Colletotrichum nupharicola]|nr:hypothetical protein COL922a_013416 [Colletotrichum nupharicola]